MRAGGTPPARSFQEGWASLSYQLLTSPGIGQSNALMTTIQASSCQTHRPSVRHPCRKGSADAFHASPLVARPQNIDCASIVTQTRLTQTQHVSRLRAMSTSSAHTLKSPPASAREVLALNIIRLRAKRGLTQEALAFEAGLHRTFIAHVERQARNISLDNIERIANALDVGVAELFRR